jgi:methyltransferase (TIGR00027 family)
MTLTGVGRTALGVARIRAHESTRPDRLFDDPHAAAFHAAFPDAFPPQGPGRVGAMFAFHVVIRTRFYDDYLRAACAEGCRQVVLLAAGLDTRAFRLDWPDGLRLFELDLPEVLAFKDDVLTASPSCARTALPVDLRENWPARLTEAGFDPSLPTAWLAEGLLVYLTAEEADLLLTRAGALSAPGSRISFERTAADAPARALAKTTPSMRPYAALWKGGLGQDPADWLGEHGWRAWTDNLGTLAAEYGRPIPREAQSGFVTAVRH